MISKGGAAIAISARSVGRKEREGEACALSGRGVHPDPSAVPLDDLLADGEADAGAGVLLARVQALEDDEDALGESRVDADAVVLR
jgi:hypothetical protein